MSVFVRSLVALAAISCIAPIASAQTYRSVGPDGRVTYSDRPPTDASKVEKVTSSRASSGSATGDAAKAGGAKSLAEQEQDFRKRRIEADEKARKDDKLAEEKRARAETCAAMRRQLAGMQSGARMARITETGEREFMEDAQIQQEIQRMQGDIAKNCKDV
jgi:hypothetical protein